MWQMQIHLTESNRKLLLEEARKQSRSVTWIANGLLDYAFMQAFQNQFGRTKIKHDTSKPKQQLPPSTFRIRAATGGIIRR